MSFADETTTGRATTATVTRVLNHLELVDLKCYTERARFALGRMPAAIHEGETPTLYEILGQDSELDGIVNTLELDSVEEPHDEPEGTVARVERITRNGGRTDG